MTQHGEKLVLAAVRFAELLFALAQRALHLLSLADVDTRADDSPRAYREHARQNVEPVVACLVSKGRLRFGDLCAKGMQIRPALKQRFGHGSAEQILTGGLQQTESGGIRVLVDPIPNRTALVADGFQHD